MQHEKKRLLFLHKQNEEETEKIDVSAIKNKDWLSFCSILIFGIHGVALKWLPKWRLVQISDYDVSCLKIEGRTHPLWRWQNGSFCRVDIGWTTSSSLSKERHTASARFYHEHRGRTVASRPSVQHLSENLQGDSTCKAAIWLIAAGIWGSQNP